MKFNHSLTRFFFILGGGIFIILYKILYITNICWGGNSIRKCLLLLRRNKLDFQLLYKWPYIKDCILKGFSMLNAKPLNGLWNSSCDCFNLLKNHLNVEKAHLSLYPCLCHDLFSMHLLTVFVVCLESQFFHFLDVST